MMTMTMTQTITHLHCKEHANMMKCKISIVTVEAKRVDKATTAVEGASTVAAAITDQPYTEAVWLFGPVVVEVR